MRATGTERAGGRCRNPHWPTNLSSALGNYVATDHKETCVSTFVSLTEYAGGLGESIKFNQPGEPGAEVWMQ